ncbi:helix-turn-helix domain-containing protein [Marinibaculum pumilum]|uniref:Helix-turn-helix domain-containing protein n=1 Tax=Marinibaculum pumilum TaxID=1766165 RepID=A0ABV7L0D8_9PROT
MNHSSPLRGIPYRFCLQWERSSLPHLCGLGRARAGHHPRTDKCELGLGLGPQQARRPASCLALSTEDLVQAKALLREERITVEQVAEPFGLAPSTLYRHQEDGRGAVKDNIRIGRRPPREGHPLDRLQEAGRCLRSGGVQPLGPLPGER